MVLAYIFATVMTLGVIVSLAVAALSRRDGEDDKRTADAAGRYAPAAPGWDLGRLTEANEASFRCRPLFFAEEHGHIRLDCLVASDGPAAAAGAPVSLDVGLPDTGWLALAVESLLAEWAEDQRVVDMSIAAHGRRLVVTNGESTIRLPLHATAGVARG